jgi:hypothetical protein
MTEPRMVKFPISTPPQVELYLRSTGNRSATVVSAVQGTTEFKRWLLRQRRKGAK